TLSFSKDLIEIEVRDPKLPPLTFVDLPVVKCLVVVDVTGLTEPPTGLIQHHQESQTIKLVENMVKFFIGGERRNNTLMLIVMPAPGNAETLYSIRSSSLIFPSEDVNNQQAMELAKRYDRHGVRTIGK
ncbi:hypothetical protein MPER_00144, partial [Moniliophthora perniciosa FA553]